MPVNLDEVLHTHVVTPRSILEEMLSDPKNLATFQNVVRGNILTVQHDFGSFQLTYDEVQDIMALRRMRGHL